MLVDRIETESHFGQNRNETELFWSIEMRPNHVFATIGTRLNYCFGHWNKTDFFLGHWKETELFFKNNESAHVILLRDSYSGHKTTRRDHSLKFI
jgi:hypothetical protein